MFPGLKNTVYRVIWVGLLCLLAAGLLAACDSEPSPGGAAPAGNAPSSSGEVPGEAPAASAPAQESSRDSGPTTALAATPATPATEAAPAPAVEAVVETPTLPAPVLATIPPRSRVTPEPATPPLVDTAAPSDSPAGPAGPAAGDLDRVLANVGPDTRWGELYQAFSDEEQACIGNELGEEQLAAALEERVYHEGDTKEWQVSIFNCIAAEKAAAVFYAGTIGQYPELTDDNKACIRQLLAGTDVPALVSATLPDTPPDQAMPLLAFSFGLLGCLPEWVHAGPPVPGEHTGPSSAPAIQDESLLWSYATGGWVVVAPAVVDGVVYAGSDDYSVYALGAATGTLLWSYATGDVIRSTPTVSDGVVYVGSNDNHLYALEAATGNLLWKYDTGEWVQYSPTVGGGLVYFGAPSGGDRSGGDRKVHAVDAVSGATVWVAAPPFPIGAEVTPTVVGCRVYAAGAGYGEFYALDAATGEEAWKVEVGGYVESAPMALDGVVYLTVVNHAYALNEMTGEAIWQVNTEEFPARDFPALVVDGIYYLAPSDNVYALDAATGEQLWSYESYMLSTAPVVADGVVYGASADAEFIFALDAATGGKLWTLPTEDFNIYALTVVDGILYGQDQEGYLSAVDVQDGFFLNSYQIGGFSDIRVYTIKDGVLYLSGGNNGIEAYAAPEGW